MGISVLIFSAIKQRFLPRPNLQLGQAEMKRFVFSFPYNTFYHSPLVIRTVFHNYCTDLTTVLNLASICSCIYVPVRFKIRIMLGAYMSPGGGMGEGWGEFAPRRPTVRETTETWSQ